MLWKLNLFPPFPEGHGADKINYIQIIPVISPSPEAPHGGLQWPAH